MGNENLFWTVVLGSLTAQLLVVAVVVGFRQWQDFSRWMKNRAAAADYIRRLGRPPTGAEIEREMEQVIGEAQAIGGSIEGAGCPVCSGRPRVFLCEIMCPAGGCVSSCKVYAHDARAGGQYRTECEKGHWGDLDPRSELLPPPWRKQDPVAQGKP